MPWRAPLLKQGGLFAPISREGALVFNNLFLTSACATVFVGTLYPLALEALTDEKISVGPPFFNATFGPLFVPLLLVMPFGPLLGWKRGDLLGAAQRLFAAAALAAVAVAAALALQHGGGRCWRRSAWGSRFSSWPARWSILPSAHCSCAFRSARRCAARPDCRGRPGARLSRISASASRLFGIVAVTAWGGERIAALKPGETIDVAHYRLTFDGLLNRPGPNYRDLVGHFTVRRASGELIGSDGAEPAHFPRPQHGDDRGGADDARGRASFICRSAIRIRMARVPVRLYFKPQVLMIWLGAVIMFIGGALSLSDRRLRIGAPRPAKSQAALQAAE